MIDDKLFYTGRYLRTQTGKLLLGPVGRRLFADYLDKLPGFSGRIDFIHKFNITSLFVVRPSVACYWESAQSCWYPSRLTMQLENARLAFSEVKFITADDCAVSCQSWHNKSQSPITLTLEAAPALCESRTDDKTGCRIIVTPPLHGFSVGVAVCSDIGIESRTIEIPPGESAAFTIAAATGNLATEAMDDIAHKASAFFGNSTTDYAARYAAEYQAFYDNAPRFTCSDALLEKTWNYRLFLLHHNIAVPDFGFLQGACMYEGRGHKTSKQPLDPAGWEFSKLINLSTPLHLLDFRWHSDKKTAREMIMNMLNNVDENGIFCSAYVSKRLHAYANFSVWAVWMFYLVDGDKSFAAEILDRLKQYVADETARYGSKCGDDHLQIETQHNRTGKEYQPSYWYFHDYPTNPKDRTTFTPLKRVDRSVYHYLNVLGLAKLCRACNDAAAASYEQTAAQIKHDILTKMWDNTTSFFYDLHHATDQMAMVKNIVGIYPFWAQIAGSEHLPGLELLFDPAYFDTGCPFPSVARDCAAYRPFGGWMDNFIKGRNGCVWCGPSWPYTTGIAIDAIGKMSKLHNHKYDEEFGRYLRRYALQHFRDNDISRPYLVEHYDAESGEPLSDEPDYNHSYFMDLIVQHVCGVHLREDGVDISPLDIGLDYFRLENLNVRGCVYDVQYERGAGLRVRKDGSPASAKKVTPP